MFVPSKGLIIGLIELTLSFSRFSSGVCARGFFSSILTFFQLISSARNCAKLSCKMRHVRHFQRIAVLRFAHLDPFRNEHFQVDSHGLVFGIAEGRLNETLHELGETLKELLECQMDVAAFQIIFSAMKEVSKTGSKGKGISLWSHEIIFHKRND